MSLFPDSIRKSRKQWGFTLVLLLLGLALEAGETEAQSGRRTAPPSPVNSTPPTPVATPENTALETEKPLAPGQLPTKVRLLVARQPTSKHLSSEDQIFASFIKQLNRYENIEASSIGDLKESAAVDRAKTETDDFVVLLKFDIDSFQNRTIITNSQDLEIE